MSYYGVRPEPRGRGALLSLLAYSKQVRSLSHWHFVDGVRIAETAQLRRMVFVTVRKDRSTGADPGAKGAMAP